MSDDELAARLDRIERLLLSALQPKRAPPRRKGPKPFYGEVPQKDLVAADANLANAGYYRR